MISSVGPPPDLHAKRVVTEMLRYLHIEYERLRARGDGIINARRDGHAEGAGTHRGATEEGRRRHGAPATIDSKI